MQSAQRAETPPESDLIRFEARFGSAPKALSRLIRPSLVAATDKTLVWGDWSAIEARTLPWLAGEPGEVVLDIFRENDRDPLLPDIYKIEAGNIYEVDPASVDKKGRQVGKVAVLALGFGGGVGALNAMAAGYRLTFTDAFAAEVVRKWRARNQWAVDFWGKLQKGFDRAWTNPEEVVPVGRLAFVFMPRYLSGTMFCYMPCGRPLTYPFLRREKVRFEDDFGDEVTEWKVRYQHGYERKSLWHGILAENPTQGFAGSLLRDLLVRLEACPTEDSFVVGHTHDEAIMETPVTFEDEVAAYLKKEMEWVPDWATGLPLVAEITRSWYYTKVGD